MKLIDDWKRKMRSLFQEQFPYKIEHVYIVKPDGFWDKHKISLGMSKYTFEVRGKNCDDWKRNFLF